MNQVLEITNLSKAFGKNKVIDNLDFKVSLGDLIYIHGANGCGKSTLFKLIAGLMDKDEGKINISSNIKIGALIENPGFIENENIKFNMEFLASLSKFQIKDYINDLCHKFSLDYESNVKMKNYSVGMRQKVGIIQAIMEEQNFIMLDEPTRGLDSDSIKTFVTLINDLVKSKKTVIIASHDKIEYLNFTKSYVMCNGKVFEE